LRVQRKILRGHPPRVEALLGCEAAAGAVDVPDVGDHAGEALDVVDEEAGDAPSSTISGNVPLR
jgi:hypothetical protein